MRDWTIWDVSGTEQNDAWMVDQFGSVAEWSCQEWPSFQLVELRERQSDVREEYVLEIRVVDGSWSPIEGALVTVAAPSQQFVTEVQTDAFGVARFSLASTKYRYAVPGEGPLQVAVHGAATDGVTGLGRAWVYDGPDRWLNPTFRWVGQAPPPPPPADWKTEVYALLDLIRSVVEGVG